MLRFCDWFCNSSDRSPLPYLHTLLLCWQCECVWDVMLVWRKRNIDKTVCLAVLCTIIMVHTRYEQFLQLVNCIELWSCSVKLFHLPSASIFGLHGPIYRRRFWHATHDCVAPYVDIILHRGRFRAKSAASGSVRWWCFRSCWMVLSHVMRWRYPLTSSWPHLRCDVGLEEGEYK